MEEEEVDGGDGGGSIILSIYYVPSRRRHSDTITAKTQCNVNLVIHGYPVLFST